MADRRGDPADVEQAVTPLELFFDLVFVFAITQVTGSSPHDAGVDAAGRGDRRSSPRCGRVGVLRVAGQHRGIRRGRRARRPAVDDGRAADRLAGGPARLRRGRAGLRRRLLRRARGAHRGVRRRLAGRPAAARRGRAPGDDVPPGVDAARPGRRRGRPRADRVLDRRAGGRLRRARWCAASPAGA